MIITILPFNEMAQVERGRGEGHIGKHDHYLVGNKLLAMLRLFFRGPLRISKLRDLMIPFIDFVGGLKN